MVVHGPSAAPLPCPHIDRHDRFEHRSAELLPPLVHRRKRAFTNSLSTTATGKNATTSLTIARPFPGVTNTQMTIVFSTTSGIASGNVIRVPYPTGFFIAPPPPQVGTCVQVDSYVFGASGLGPCSSVSAGGEFGPASIGMSRVDVTYSVNCIRR
jgi:hypothetical protein